MKKILHVVIALSVMSWMVSCGKPDSQKWEELKDAYGQMTNVADTASDEEWNSLKETFSDLADDLDGHTTLNDAQKDSLSETITLGQNFIKGEYFKRRTLELFSELVYLARDYWQESTPSEVVEWWEKWKAFDEEIKAANLKSTENIFTPRQQEIITNQIIAMSFMLKDCPYDLDAVDL